MDLEHKKERKFEEIVEKIGFVMFEGGGKG